MKTFTTIALMLGMLTAAQATPLSEEMLDKLTAMTMKRCLVTHEDTRKIKTHKPEEIENYCACWSVTIINLTTQEDYDYNLANGKWLNEIEDGREAEKHCRKYLNYPDGAALRKKKW
jgi:hypothetical protein